MVKDRVNDLSIEGHQVAGNGLLDRRLFLKRGVQFGVINGCAVTQRFKSIRQAPRLLSVPLRSGRKSLLMNEIG